jgi:hypothetical protein
MAKWSLTALCRISAASRLSVNMPPALSRDEDAAVLVLVAR